MHHPRRPPPPAIPRSRAPPAARALNMIGVERNRARQIGAPDHLDREGLPRRHVERVRGARQQRASARCAKPGPTPAQRQRRERARARHHRDLRDEQNAPPVEPVGDDARERRDQQHRRLSHKRHETQQERRIRQPVNQPRLRDRLHPKADQRNRLARKEEPVIPVAKDARAARRFRLCRMTFATHAQTMVRMPK